MYSAEHATDERDENQNNVHQAHNGTREVCIEIEQHESSEEEERGVDDDPLAAQHVKETIAE